jgi:hypothetical protein
MYLFDQKEYDWAAISYFGDNAKLNFGVANV